MLSEKSPTSDFERRRIAKLTEITSLQAQQQQLAEQQRQTTAELRQLKRQEDLDFIQKSPVAVVLHQVGVALAREGHICHLTIVDPETNEYSEVKASLVWDPVKHGNETKSDDYGPEFELPHTAGIRYKSVELAVVRNKSGEIIGLEVRGSVYSHFNRRSLEQHHQILTAESSQGEIRAAIEEAVSEPKRGDSTLGDIRSLEGKTIEELFEMALSSTPNIRLE